MRICILYHHEFRRKLLFFHVNQSNSWIPDAETLPLHYGQYIKFCILNGQLKSKIITLFFDIFRLTNQNADMLSIEVHQKGSTVVQLRKKLPNFGYYNKGHFHCNAQSLGVYPEAPFNWKLLLIGIVIAKGIWKKHPHLTSRWAHLYPSHTACN